MNNVTIRKMNRGDISEVVEIWYETSLSAHSFIAEEYWNANRELMKTEYLPASETYVAVTGGAVAAFVSLSDNCLAAIFTAPSFQGRGIGRLLIEYVQNLREVLQLNVYKKNKASIEFYRNRGFSILSETVDEATGEGEYVMEWRNLYISVL